MHNTKKLQETFPSPVKNKLFYMHHIMKMIAIFLALFSFVSAAFAGNFYQDFAVAWGGGRARSFDNGNSLTLTLDRESGSGFRSKKQYLFGKIDMKIKLVPGNSAGTVTTYYLSSLGQFHDEIDFEFLGNVTGQPYVMHTNVYAQGKGSKEQQFYLWFDPTKDFHTYSIQWNPQSIIFSVDGTPVRQFKNLESRGIPFPKSQPMWIYASLWNADDWATRGGLVKTDWSKAPFYATFTGFNALSCPSYASCSTNSWFSQSLDYAAIAKMKWIQKTYMVYNYCTDYRRFPQGFPPECSIA